MFDKSAFAKNLGSIIIKRIEEKKLVLPALPDAAVKVDQALKDPAVDLKKIAAILELDPVLAAQALNTANSVAFRRGPKVETISRAVSLLGIRNIKSLLVSVAARQVFTSRIPMVSSALSMIWNHCQAVALLAKDVASIAGCADQDVAYITGLLHDIGQPVVSIYLLEVERTLLSQTRSSQEWMNLESWIDVIQEIHRPVGVTIAKHWNLPDVVASAVELCDSYETGVPNSLGNVVMFCNALAEFSGFRFGHVEEEDISTRLAKGRELLQLDEDLVDNLVEVIKEVMAEE